MIRYKKTPESFLLDIVNLYKEARKAKTNNFRVKRGRSHGISSLSEDLFAEFLAENLEQYNYLVDQPITIENRRGLIYPDVAVIKENRIIQIIDLKMDLGYNRNQFVEFCEDKELLIASIRDKTCKTRNGITKEINQLSIDENLKYHIVVISDTNISKEKMNTIVEKTNRFKNLDIYILSSNQPPNVYEENKICDIKINKSEFDRLMCSLKI